jgi:hypothetical protein
MVLHLGGSPVLETVQDSEDITVKEEVDEKYIEVSTQGNQIQCCQVAECSAAEPTTKGPILKACDIRNLQQSFRIIFLTKGRKEAAFDNDINLTYILCFLLKFFSWYK